MKTLIESGITWTYRLGHSYAAEYEGFRIAINRTGGAAGRYQWRLFVNGPSGGGIGLSFKKQFWPDVAAARREAKRLVDEHKAKQ